MDNSSQNGPGIQQPETQNSNGYQQYLDPGGKPNKQRKIIIISAIAAGVLLIILAAAIFARSSDQNKQPSQRLPAVVACTDKDCIKSNFTQCVPAEYTDQERDVSSVKYTVKGLGEIGCSVEMGYIANKYQPEIQGKSMVCDFDNTADLDDAVQYVLDYPDDYDCQGELAEFLKTLENIE